MKRVGITMGDPCGIGPELIAGLLAEEERLDAHLHIYGSEKVYRSLCENFGLEKPKTNHIVFHPCGEPSGESYEFNHLEERADLVLRSIQMATEDALAGSLDALLTAPLDKKVVQSIDPNFTGHTGFLAKLAGNVRTAMVLDNQELRVALLTEHIPLREVPEKVTVENISEMIEVCRSGLVNYAGQASPRIAIAGLNPHAGEIGDCPEDLVIESAVKKLLSEGVQIEGPISADSLFGLARGYVWDLILSPYHDQGLVAAKYPGLNKVVNITLGLPFLRVSPGHGVAYDCVGTNKTDHRSFRRAFKMAMKGRIS